MELVTFRFSGVVGLMEQLLFYKVPDLKEEKEMAIGQIILS